MSDDVKFSRSKQDRLVAALKGTGVFADPRNRVVVRQSVLRDFSGLLPKGQIQTAVCGGGGNGVVNLTDPSGNEYAMLDILGFADGKTLY